MKQLCSLLVVFAIVSQQLAFTIPQSANPLSTTNLASPSSNSSLLPDPLKLILSIIDALTTDSTPKEVAYFDADYPAPDITTPTVEPTPELTQEPSPAVTTPTIEPTGETPTTIPTTDPTSETPTPVPTIDASPSPTISATDVAEKITLELRSKRIKPGDQFPVRWEISGVSGFDASQVWELLVNVPSGFEVPANTPGTFDAQNATLRLPISTLKGDFSLQAAQDFLGAQPVHVELLENGTIASESDLNVIVKNWVFVSKKGGEVTGLDGKVKVKIPPSALTEDIEVAVGRPSIDSKLPNSYSGNPIEIIAEGLQSQQEIQTFNDVITLEMTYDETQVQGDPATLAWFYYDYTYETWIPVASEVDTVNHTVRAYTYHFSDWEVNPRDWLGAKIPPLANADVSLFSGAATYSLPVDLPAGPGGLAPTVSLNYNSQIVDAANSKTQASWAGMGWNLAAGGMIRRNMGNGSLTDLNDDTFTLTLEGKNLNLVPVNKVSTTTPNYIEYKTAEETYWRIRKYLVSSTVSADTAYPYSKEFDKSYWEITDKAGNLYRFDFRSHYVNYIYPIAYPVWGWYLSEVKHAAGPSFKFYYRTVPLHKYIGN